MLPDACLPALPEIKRRRYTPKNPARLTMTRRMNRTRITPVVVNPPPYPATADISEHLLAFGLYSLYARTGLFAWTFIQIDPITKKLGCFPNV
jgi:hypothetical protein